MSICIDTSVLVAAMVGSEAHHHECRALVAAGDASMYGHGLAETFTTLTGGRKAFRLSAATVSDLLDNSYAPRLQLISLTPREMLVAMSECEARGVRGGAIFDFLHLRAARKCGAETFYTLNHSHFQAFYQSGDPEVRQP